MKTNVEWLETIKSVVWFYALAYAISWLIWSPLVLFPQQSERLGVLVLAGSFGPFLAAGIAAWIEGGRAGCGRWLKTAFKWRIHFGWYLLGGLGLPLLIAVLHVGLGALLGGRVSLSGDPAWHWRALFFPLSVIVNAVISSAGGEEPGWRGFALPRLAERMHPLIASALMGCLWGPWHLPLFFTPLWQGREPFWLMFLYCIPLTVIFNWLTFKAKQSALPAMLLHAGGNGYGALFVMAPISIGSLALGFTSLKTIVYGLVALVLIVVTQGRLGYDAYHRTDRHPSAQAPRPPGCAQPGRSDPRPARGGF